MTKFICPCGKEAKNKAGLASHQRKCDKAVPFEAPQTPSKVAEEQASQKAVSSPLPGNVFVYNNSNAPIPGFEISPSQRVYIKPGEVVEVNKSVAKKIVKVFGFLELHENRNEIGDNPDDRMKWTEADADDFVDGIDEIAELRNRCDNLKLLDRYSKGERMGLAEEVYRGILKSYYEEKRFRFM